MRIIFLILAVLFLIGGINGDVQAKTAIHQVLAQIDYLIFAVFLVGAGIVSAVGKNKPIAPQPIPVLSEPSPGVADSMPAVFRSARDD
jgi:hypothetical protein